MYYRARSKFFDLLTELAKATTDWTVFKDLKQSADEAVEVFLIKVRRHFLSAMRKNTASRKHLNMELVRQAVEGLNITAVHRAVVGYKENIWLIYQISFFLLTGIADKIDSRFFVCIHISGGNENLEEKRRKLVLYCTRKEETAKLLTRLTTAGGKAVKDILKVEELDLEGMCHEELVPW